MASSYLSKSAIKGLTRIGDILIPGNDEFPSFSTFMCMDHIDDLVAYAPQDDIKDLGKVLGLLSFMPKRVLLWLVKTMSKSHTKTGPLGIVLRQLNMGIRGLIFSLYYSAKPGTDYNDKNPTELIGFTLNKVQI